MIATLAAAVTGPRGRWVTIAVWVALGIGGYLGRSHVGEVTAAGQSSFLPKGAESIHALEVFDGSGTAGETSDGKREEVPAVVVFDRTGGLTNDDLNAIGKIGHGLNELKITGATPIVDPFSAEPAAPLGDIARLGHGIGPISDDGEAALVVLALNADDRGAIRQRRRRDPRLPRRPRGPRGLGLRHRAGRDRRRPRPGRRRSRARRCSSPPSASSSSCCCSSTGHRCWRCCR